MTIHRGAPHGSFTRRQFVQLGSMAIGAVSVDRSLWTPPEPISSPIRARARHVILIFLRGGPSHLDTWDPKPDAPEHIRGRFSAIETNVPGILISETMPLLANQMDKCVLVRSMSYVPNGMFSHDSAVFEVLTGLRALDAAPSGELSPDGIPPPQTRLPDSFKCETGIVLHGNPQLPFGLGLPQVQIPLDQSTTARAIPPDSGRISNQKNMVLSTELREALTPDALAERTSERYGHNSFGRAVCAAHRLVRAGVRFVQVNWPDDMPSWDTHRDSFCLLREILCPRLDRALSALLCDLNSDGLLNETLVLALGEFGRAPRLGVSTSGTINSFDGRDHWPFCFTALLAGASIKGGRTYGESDASGSFPETNPVHPQELISNVWYALGLASAPAADTKNPTPDQSGLRNTLWE